MRRTSQQRTNRRARARARGATHAPPAHGAGNVWATMDRAMLVALSLPLAWGAPPMLPGGCELLKLPADASPSTDEERGCFNDWKDEKRLLRHGIPGCCGTPDTFCLDKPPVGLDKALWDGTCVAAKMTPAMCGAMCWALGAVATDGPYTLAGVEAGNQCCERASCTSAPSVPSLPLAR